jgi:non-specific serine/threonine protein kinase
MPAVLTQALCDWEALLILDHCKPLLTACAIVTTTLLGKCRHLCILAASHEPLAVLGETLWWVQPLNDAGCDGL